MCSICFTFMGLFSFDVDFPATLYVSTEWEIWSICTVYHHNLEEINKLQSHTSGCFSCHHLISPRPLIWPDHLFYLQIQALQNLRGYRSWWQKCMISEWFIHHLLVLFFCHLRKWWDNEPRPKLLTLAQLWDGLELVHDVDLGGPEREKRFFQ